MSNSRLISLVLILLIILTLFLIPILSSTVVFKTARFWQDNSSPYNVHHQRPSTLNDNKDN